MIPEILKKRMHQVQDFIRKGDHKMKKTLLFIFLICIIFTSCSDNSFDYTVYECLTGIYGLNIPSSNHKQEIIRTTEYTDNTIISSKKIFFEERDYNLNYTHSETDIRIPYKIDCFSNRKENSTDFIELKYKKGTNEVFSIFKSYIPSSDIQILSEEEVINAVEEYIRPYIDFTLYDERTVSFIEDDQVYVIYYYNKYQDILLGDGLYICSRSNGDVFVFQNYYNDLKNKIAEMNINIDKAKCESAIRKKLDSIYGEGKYESTCTGAILYLSPEGIPYLDIKFDVRYEGIFTADICNLLIFMNN